MLNITDLPSESPFALAIEDEVLRTRWARLVEGHEEDDVDYIFVEPLEDELVREALSAHDVYETWLELTGG